MSSKMSSEELVSRLIAKFGSSYDYSKVVANGSKAPIVLSCPQHGEFSAVPNRLLHPRTKHCCPSCGRASGGLAAKARNTRTPEVFVAGATDKHGPRYDYSKVLYQGSFKKVIIICKLHGEFLQSPHHHLSGTGCPTCGAIASGAAERKFNTKSTDEFIASATAKHHGYYKYSNANYTSAHGMVVVECPIHGTFSIFANNHLKGRGCPECGKKSSIDSRRDTKESFVEKATAVHGDLYDYSKTTYLRCNSKVEILCKDHGSFWMIPNAHLCGQGCPKCRNTGLPSKEEKDLFTYVTTLTDAEQSNRSLLKRLELDIVLHKEKLAVEYCGLYWHSEQFSPDRNRHLKKLIACQEVGYRLITVFSDEWLYKRPVVESLLRDFILREEKPIVGARKCRIEVLTHKEVSTLYNETHLQGTTSAELHLGLVRNGEVLAAISVSKTRAFYGGVRNIGELELVRFCTNSRYRVPGALKKLCSSIPLHMPGVSLVSYVDRRWFTGESYEKAGFLYDGSSSPGYGYTSGSYRESRFKFAKHKLSQRLKLYDPLISEKDNMAANGWYRVFDCGQLRFRLSL